MKLSFRNAMRGGLAAAGLIALAVGQNANAATVPTVFDTGVLTNNPTTGAPATFSSGGVDTHYTVTSSTVAFTPATLGAGGSAFVIPPGVFPSTVYVPNPGSLYISPAANFIGTASTFYDYHTTFDLSGFRPGTASLSGRFSDDDNLVALFINGQLTGVVGNPPATGTDFLPTPGAGGTVPPIAFTLSNPAFFTSGVNTLDFIVLNGTATTNNFTALAVGGLTLTATAVPEPGSIAMLVGIGVSGAGFLVRRKRRA